MGKLSRFSERNRHDHCCQRGILDKSVDVSKGKTIWQKVQSIMGYAFGELGGENGIITIDNGMNTGRFSASSSNYWDNPCFGYHDPYETMLFYESLNSMAGLCKLQGMEVEEQRYLEAAGINSSYRGGAILQVFY